MTRFEVWSPTAGRVELVVGDRYVAMTPEDCGWWTCDVADAGPGTDYAFSLDGGPPRPDPRSRRQPTGVHGPSRVLDPGGFAWTDAGWPGIDVRGRVVYELHVGTFTAEGTFAAAVGHLDHLVDVGVDLVELMPVASFGGMHGWGYDGVALWSVHEPYGGPAGLAAFVDACHARGLGVLLDVVYNHLGPSGNYLSEFGPYFTDRHTTPWGAAVNLDDEGSEQVRRFVVGNALAWLRDYHLDGLRLDAVHALVDGSRPHLLAELSDAVSELSTTVGRPLSLVAESDENDPVSVLPTARGGRGMTAQWADDVHHALHALLTGERQGYYVDFGSLAVLAHALTKVFVHDGGWSTFRGRAHGHPVDAATVSGHRFVAFLQDHDQVGNRAAGDRISASLTPGLLAVGAALVLTSAFTPMLFMGEEWGASTPWRFFSGHEEPGLATAIREGRRAEFASHGWSAADVPDPQDPATRDASVLDWSEPGREPHRSVLAFYRALLALRRAEPDLRDGRLDLVDVGYDEAARWVRVRRGSLVVVANLGDRSRRVHLGGQAADIALAWSPADLDGDGVVVQAESVAVVRLEPGTG